MVWPSGAPSDCARPIKIGKYEHEPSTDCHVCHQRSHHGNVVYCQDQEPNSEQENINKFPRQRPLLDIQGCSREHKATHRSAIPELTERLGSPAVDPVKSTSEPNYAGALTGLWLQRHNAQRDSGWPHVYKCSDGLAYVPRKWRVSPWPILIDCDWKPTSR